MGGTIRYRILATAAPITAPPNHTRQAARRRNRSSKEGGFNINFFIEFPLEGASLGAGERVGPRPPEYKFFEFSDHSLYCIFMRRKIISNITYANITMKKVRVALIGDKDSPKKASEPNAVGNNDCQWKQDQSHQNASDTCFE
jgi:hypothetical protein